MSATASAPKVAIITGASQGIGAGLAAGFRRARLPGNILRFETAAIVGVALARASADRVAPRTTTAPGSA